MPSGETVPITAPPNGTPKYGGSKLGSFCGTSHGIAQSDTEKARRAESDFLSYTNDAGRVADFHSLRHGFITNLVKSGASPKDAQALARHSTITLTMDRYVHVGISDIAGALERLPELPTTGSKAKRLHTTGTDGRPDTPVTGPNRVALNVALKPVANRLAESSIVATESGNGDAPVGVTYGEIEGSVSSCPSLSHGVASSPGRARTSDTRINSPLLYRLSYRGM